MSRRRRKESSHSLGRPHTWWRSYSRGLKVETCESRLLLDGHGISASLDNPIDPIEQTATTPLEHPGAFYSLDGSFRIDNSVPFETSSLEMLDFSQAKSTLGVSNVTRQHYQEVDVESREVTFGLFDSDWEYSTDAFDGSEILTNEMFMEASFDNLNTPSDLFFNTPLNLAFDTAPQSLSPLEFLQILAPETAREETNFLLDTGEHNQSVAENTIARSTQAHQSSSSYSSAKQAIVGPILLNPNSAPSDFDSAFFRLGQASSDPNPVSLSPPSSNLNFSAPSISMVESVFPNSWQAEDSQSDNSNLLNASAEQNQNAHITSQADFVGSDSSSETKITDSSKPVSRAEPDKAVGVTAPSIRVQTAVNDKEQHRPTEIDIARVFYRYDANGRLQPNARTLARAQAATPDSANGAQEFSAQLAQRSSGPRRGVVRSLEISVGPERAIARRMKTPAAPNTLEFTQSTSAASRLQHRLSQESDNSPGSDTAVVDAAIQKGGEIETIVEPALEKTTLSWLSAKLSSLPSTLGHWLPHTVVVMIVSLAALIFSPRETAPVTPENVVGDKKRLSF